MKAASDVLARLQGRTLATAESCTGGGVGAEITSVAGASRVYVGGIVSYTNAVKARVLGVDRALLERVGAVSAPVAQAMAEGARRALCADVAVSTTGLAGPDGDEYGNPVGTVFIGYSDETRTVAREFHFQGDREQVRAQAIEAALALILEYC